MNQTFKKEERLTNKTTIDSLFASGNSLFIHPFRLIWTSKNSKMRFPAQVAISVPKKSFSKSTHRNRIKRKIKEAYRKNKYLIYEFLEKNNLCIALMIVYVSKKELSYEVIQEKMIVSLHKLIKKIK